MKIHRLAGGGIDPSGKGAFDGPLAVQNFEVIDGFGAFDNLDGPGPITFGASRNSGTHTRAQGEHFVATKSVTPTT